MTALNEDAAARIRPRHVAVIMDGNGRGEPGAFPGRPGIGPA